jgi:threonyl-tRNA synthetase
VEVDDRNEKMNAKIRDFANQKTPYILVFGDKEEAAGGERAHARARGDQGSMPLADFIAKAKALVKNPMAPASARPRPESAFWPTRA